MCIRDRVVAPEDGAEVSLDTIALRVTQLVLKNSARFEKQQKGAAEERKALEEAKEAVRDEMCIRDRTETVSNTGVTFDASRVVPTGPENVPVHVLQPVIIYLGNQV